MGSRAQYYKTFYARNLQIFALSQSVLRTGRKSLSGTSTLACYKLRKLRAKKFYNMGPRAEYYKTFYAPKLQIFCNKLGWRYDSQHNDSQHNDIQHNDIQHYSK
jgi:hypothetical protein